jgi:periplasmic protein TonB
VGGEVLILPFNNRWNKYLVISVSLHIALLSVPISIVARQGINAIDVSLVTQNEPQPEAKKPPPRKPEPPKPMKVREKPPLAQRPEETKDVKAQIVSPGEQTVMNVAPGVGDAATGVAIAGAKVGTGGSAIGGSMPGGTGTGAGYGYGGTVDGQFGRGEGPSFAYREMPEYPFAAKRLGKEGRVILQVTIDPKGRLEGVEVVEASDRMFVDAAVDSIRKSKFNPGKRTGVACRYRCKVAIRFVLGT